MNFASLRNHFHRRLALMKVTQNKFSAQARTVTALQTVSGTTKIASCFFQFEHCISNSAFQAQLYQTEVACCHVLHTQKSITVQKYVYKNHLCTTYLYTELKAVDYKC